MELHGTGYLTKIVAKLNALFESIMLEAPDATHNTGRFLAEAYFWDAVQSIAKGRSEKAWAKMIEHNILDGAKDRDPGEYELASSPHFVCNLKVSEKRRAFNADVLADKLAKSKFKVPKPIARQFIENAKVPGKSSNTYKIEEKAV